MADVKRYSYGTNSKTFAMSNMSKDLPEINAPPPSYFDAMAVGQHPPSSARYVVQQHAGPSHAAMPYQQQQQQYHHHVVTHPAMQHHQAAHHAAYYHAQQQQQQYAQQQHRAAQLHAQRNASSPRSTQSASVPRAVVPRTDGALPVVIPQTTAKVLQTFMAPFARAYPPQMAQQGVSMHEFITFIDGLNEAFMSSPIFQALNLAGTITSTVPSVIAMGVGTAVSVTSGFAGAATSYARTRAYIAKVNEQTFGPRGLRVRILSTKAMMEVIGAAESRLQLPPLPEWDEAWDPSSAATDPRMRRMQALEGQVAPLDWDVPPMAMPNSVLRKMGAWQARKQEAKERKKHDKMCRKANNGWSSDSSDSSSDSEDEEHLGRKMDKLQRKADEKMRDKPKKAASIAEKRDEEMGKLQEKMDKARRKAVRKDGKKKSKGDKGRAKVEKREDKVNQRIRWIVIVPVGQTSLSDSPSEADVDLGIDEKDVDRKRA